MTLGLSFLMNEMFSAMRFLYSLSWEIGKLENNNYDNVFFSTYFKQSIMFHVSHPLTLLSQQPRKVVDVIR